MNILLVDDKVDVVQGIKRGVQWDLIGDVTLFEAYSGLEALAVIREQQIDLLISDIEMPGMNGIEMAAKVRQESEATGIIMLSSHDSFRYAQNAIRLGCMDYILQPVDYETLRKSIERVICMMAERDKAKGLPAGSGEPVPEAYNTGRIDKNRAWRRVIVSSPKYTPEMVRETLANVGIEADDGREYRLVLLRLYWQKGSLGGWKNNELEDAFAKRMEETLSDGLPLVRLIPMYDNEWLLLFYEADLAAHLQMLIGQGSQDKTYRLAAYISESCGLYDLHEAYGSVVEMRDNNISSYSGVYEYARNHHGQGESLNASMELSIHRWKGWLLEGQESQIEEEIAAYLKQKEDRKELKRSTIAIILQMVTDTYYNSDDEGIRELMKSEPFSAMYVKATESAEDLLTYVRELAKSYAEFRKNRNEEIGQALVRKIKNYISAHLGNRLSRTEISEEFYISRDYVSHLFSKYENINYTQYVNEQRLEKAKELLAKTALPVNVIAGSVGVSEYSYFSKMFKDYTGMSANEYRAGFRKKNG